VSLKNVDMEQVLSFIAERRMREAAEAGKFDNLEGSGKPLHLEPLPADEDARAMYWAVRIMRKNDVLTDSIKAEARRRTR
jgi:hypothetical protein